MSKLFDDASLAMIPSAYSDGRLYSIRPVPELGSELNPNVDFSSDTDWSHARGNWAISGGTLNTTSENDYCFVDIGNQSNKTLRVEFDIVSHSAGRVQVRLFGATTKYGAERNAVGTYVEYIDVPAGHNGSIGFQGFSSFTGAIDNVSYKVVSNNGDFTFSRGSNLAATRVDVNGIIEKGRENLLTYSNDFSQWTPVATTATSGQIGYDGTNNAWLLTKSSASGQIGNSSTYTGVFTQSVYIKAGSLNWVALNNSGSGQTGTYFDLQNGVIGTEGSNVIKSTITPIGNGWYRCSQIINTTANVMRIYPADGDGDVSGSSGSIYIQDAQLEAGLVATDYIETGASTAQAGILEDMPRLDYSGSCPALLLEPQRTNFVTDSEYFAGLNLYGSISATYGAYTNPSGNDSAYLLEATSAISRIQTLSSTGDGNSAVMSIFIKGNDNVSYPTLANQGGGQYTRWEFDANNVLTYYDGDAPSGDYGQEDYGNGWYRIWLKTDTINGSTNYYRFNPDNRYGVGSLYAWGFQVEKNSSYPTSYIPTYGSSVTRLVDETYTPAQDELTSYCVLVDLENLNDGGGSARFIDKTTADISIHGGIYLYSGSEIGYYSSTTSYLYNGLNVADGARHKYLLRVTDGFIEEFFDGIKQSTTGTNSNDKYNRLRVTPTNQNPSIHQLAVFPTALTDSECIALTTI